MKKLLTALIIIIFASFFFTNLNGKKTENGERVLNTGILGYHGITEQAFQSGFDNFRDFVLVSDDKNNVSEDNFIKSFVKEKRVFHFYDSLMALMMDLKAGKIDEMILPDSVGEYLISKNSFYKNVFSTEILTSNVCFGFKKDNTALKTEFDEVINEMHSDGTLDKFEDKYIETSGDREPEPTRPLEIDNAEELKIVVTGDMPPIDMFAGDGKPAGYNTAVLSEIGKRLNKNIKFINTDAGGRSAALFSGRADVVFWYRAAQSNVEGKDPLDRIFADAPEGVILSIPYYSWGNEIVIRMNNKQGLLGLF